jgi:hypothetical protein
MMPPRPCGPPHGRCWPCLFRANGRKSPPDSTRLMLLTLLSGGPHDVALPRFRLRRPAGRPHHDQGASRDGNDYARRQRRAGPGHAAAPRRAGAAGRAGRAQAAGFRPGRDPVHGLRIGAADHWRRPVAAGSRPAGHPPRGTWRAPGPRAHRARRSVRNRRVRRGYHPGLASRPNQGKSRSGR